MGQPAHRIRASQSLCQMVYAVALLPLQRPMATTPLQASHSNGTLTLSMGWSAFQPSCTSLSLLSVLLGSRVSSWRNPSHSSTLRESCFPLGLEAAHHEAVVEHRTSLCCRSKPQYSLVSPGCLRVEQLAKLMPPGQFRCAKPFYGGRIRAVGNS